MLFEIINEKCFIASSMGKALSKGDEKGDKEEEEEEEEGEKGREEAEEDGQKRNQRKMEKKENNSDFQICYFLKFQRLKSAIKKTRIFFRKEACVTSFVNKRF